MPIPSRSLPKKPGTREQDAIQQVLSVMEDKGLEKIPWRDFQKEFQQISHQFPQLIAEIRHNQPLIFRSDLQSWLDHSERSKFYEVTYDRFHRPEHSFRDVEEMVLQLNASAEVTQEMMADQELFTYFQRVGEGSQMSDHPAGRNGVGWLRVDFVNKDLLLVVEVQSDLVNSITQAKVFLQTENFEEFYALQNPELQKKFQEMGMGMARGGYQLQKHWLQMHGYTLESLDRIRDRMVELFESWTEMAMATILEIARTHGIKNVAIATCEAIIRRDPAAESPKLKMYYDSLAKSFGFKKQKIQTPEISGNFWVRQASRNFLH